MFPDLVRKWAWSRSPFPVRLRRLSRRVRRPSRARRARLGGVAVWRRRKDARAAGSG